MSREIQHFIFQGLRPRAGSAGRSLERTRPPPNPADADDARPWNSSPRATGPVVGARVLMMLAGWPPWGRPRRPRNPP